MLNNTCSICLNEIESNKKKLNCNHTFHEECIKKWFKSPYADVDEPYKIGSCPICRKESEELFIDDFEIPTNNFKNNIYFLFKRIKSSIARSL